MEEMFLMIGSSFLGKDEIGNQKGAYLKDIEVLSAKDTKLRCWFSI